MGLREVNAARTRELILDAALRLFLERGYDATRMEEVAEAAGVGTSTLYRYFPTKDLLVLEPLALRGQMATELRGRPAGEPLDVALGHAVVALLATPRAGVERLRQLTTVVEGAETLQVRLMEEFRRERAGLEAAVAQRLGRPPDDLYCVATARLATLVLELVSDRLGSLPDDPAAAEQQLLALTREVMAGLQAEPPVLPRYEG
ncbi:TetR/AcrR family transcriptional regulator [Nocardioides taihuensis]|uniref:TetR/AcrR family transcriptional regulator n=1 Tax=Nocardioides taihuensis TaxID=1835606 RepID=A0ABW0BFR5_9ACTN